MIYYSFLSDDNLWWLILRGKQKSKKGKKLKHTRIQSSSLFSIARNKKTGKFLFHIEPIKVKFP